MAHGYVHFHKSDDRFCGTKQQGRQFSFNPNAVTCPHCQKLDTFVLSARATAYVAELEVTTK